MCFFRPIHLLGVLPLFAVLALLPGCQEEVKGKKRPYSDAGDLDVAKVAIVPKSYGTVSGRITFEGTLPPPAAIAMGNNEAVCHQGAPAEETHDESWLVSGPNGGVKNVVVLLQPGEGKFFQIPESQLQEKDVKVEQPRCAFIPRVFTLFCAYWDGKTNQYVETPNKLIVQNNAPFSHNFSLLAGRENPGRNLTMPRDDTKVLTSFVPESAPLTMKCDIHTWMRCFGFMLDHPYAAVTDKDGNFKIENAPLGVEVQVVGWHQPIGFFGEGGQKGVKMTLQDNQVLNLPKLKVGR
jgi:hypothetical protein